MNFLGKNLNRICVLIVFCLISLLIPGASFANSEDTAYSLTVKYPVEDVQVSVYQVAEFSDEGRFTLRAPYTEYRDSVHGLDTLEAKPEEFHTDTWMELAKTLDHLVQKDHLDADGKMTTGADGTASIDIPKGLYLIVPKEKASEDAVYTAVPVLMTLPRQNEAGQWEHDITLDFSGKVSIEEVEAQYRVEKIWKDENAESRPESIEVVLLQDYVNEYDTVVLNADNNWRYTWKNLPKGHQWGAYEKEIPKGYRVSYDEESTIMYIKNYDTPEETPPGETPPEETPPGETPPKEELPNTGQLWWPVPILAVLGLAFFAAGWIRFNHGERKR